MGYRPGEQYNLYQLLKKADEGNLDAMEDVVLLMAAEGYLEDDPDGEIAERHITYLRRLAEAGRAEFCIMLGDTYLNGTDTPADPEEAMKCFRLAAENGIPFGNECIGMIYYEGKDVPADYEKAYAYFTQDSCKKSFCTRYALGEMYRQGLYVAQSDEKACEFYSSIVNDQMTNPEIDDYYWRACFRLGTACHYGQGTEKNYDLAVKLLSKAKNLFESRGENALDCDITKEDFNQEWLLLNQDAGNY
ncbi:MAG: sel1 repeat family protein [Sarcina sp.]|nr:sel1 repeat family protein [Sarcina sp.]